MQTMVAKFEELTKLGFDVPPYELVRKADIPAYFERVKAERPTLGYDIDGLVFSVNDCAKLEALGVYEDRQKPKGQIALKFPAQGSIVTIKAIHWSADGAAHLSPVAIFDPVELAGAVVQRAHLKSINWMSSRAARIEHFRKELIKRGTPKAEAATKAVAMAGTEETVGIGSVVEIVRSGDVIPKIQSVVSNLSGDLLAPTCCPSCGGPVERNGAFMDCINNECRSKEAARMRRFLVNLRVKGLGQDTLVLYAEAGVTLLDFFLRDGYLGIESKIRKHPDISMNIWAKIKAQLVAAQQATSLDDLGAADIQDEAEEGLDDASTPPPATAGNLFADFGIG